MMVSSNHQTTSYANRTKVASSASSSTSTTDVEKVAVDGASAPVLNGSANPTPNFWTARKEQMAAAMANSTVPSSKSTTVGTPSSSSSPTLVASPPLPSSVNLRSPNGVNLDDTSSWPDVAAAATPTKDRDRERGKEKPPVPSPASTPKKNEKTKWIPIPPSELQAAADASPTKQRGHRASSVQSSPKLTSRGRRLPTDEAHDTSNPRRRSPSHLASHAYTHPFNSPTRQPTSLPITRPSPLPRKVPHQPPLTRQKRPVAPERSGPVAGYRDIDDLKIAEGRLVMFGSIGSGEERVLDGDTRGAAESMQGRGKSGAGGIAIGVKPDELPRSVKPPVREIVDLTDGAWIGTDSKWEFGTSSQNYVPSPNQNYSTNHYSPHGQHGVFYPQPPPSHPHPDSADHPDYETARPYYRNDRGNRRSRGRGGRRGMSHPQHPHYVSPLQIPDRYAMQDRYPAPGPAPEMYSPPGPVVGPDGYYVMPYYYPPFSPSSGPGVAVPFPPPPTATAAYPPPLPMPAPMPPSAPIPIPVTATPFPIDPMRWYLLGQIEYYFSIQNLVTDFWLRKQMDSNGWIPISTIASFNRIRQLTANAYDTTLVKDVMALSSLIEVYEDWVRLRNRQWVAFVLPNAAASVVGASAEAGEQQPAESSQYVADGTMGGGDEEEEVVFVMEKGQEEVETSS